MLPHGWIGLFALHTLLLTGAAIGRLFGFSTGEGVYLTVFILALIGWLVGRRAHRRERSR